MIGNTKAMAAAASALLLTLDIGPLFSDETCPNDLVQADSAFWAHSPIMTETWYRDLIADYYGMEKDDWDGGWGWTKYNDPDPYLWEFCKMMSSGRLLFDGFSDIYTLQGGWWIERQWFNTGQSTTHGTLRVISRHQSSLDVLYRNASGHLKRHEFSQTPFYADWSAWTGNQTRDEYVVPPNNDPKGHFLLGSNPAVLSRSTTTLDVFACSLNKDLLHFHWDEGVGWTQSRPTTMTVRTQPIGPIERYFISSEPLAISRSQNTMDVFALDDFKHLIHYWWNDGVWSAEDLSQVVGEEHHVASDPVILRRNNQVMDVVARSSLGHLLHYQWTQENGWLNIDVSSHIGTTRTIEGTPVALSPDNTSLTVYARSGHRVVMYAWTELTGWVELDVTRDQFAVEGDPAGIKLKENHTHVFIRDINGHLVHSFFAPVVGFQTEDLTTMLSGQTIGGDPVVIASNDERIDVFSLSQFNQLIHYYWTSQFGWKWENVHDAGFDQSIAFVATKPVVAMRGSESLHVYSGAMDKLWDGTLLADSDRYSQFYCAIGPTVNSWHTNKEYRDWAAGGLHGFKYKPFLSSSVDTTVAMTVSKSEIRMHCLSFGKATGLRSMVMVHEATHAILWPKQHVECPGGSEIGQTSCDPWDFHWVRDPAGALLPTLDNHTPYQVSVEYLADLTEFYHADLPLEVLDRAKEVAELFLDERIIDPPGWVVGYPRPVQ